MHRRLVQKDCALAGHSLGEYSALTSIANVLHISVLVNVVFYCGITEVPAAESAEVSSALAATPVPASVTAPVAAPAAAIEDVPL